MFLFQWPRSLYRDLLECSSWSIFIKEGSNDIPFLLYISVKFPPMDFSQISQYLVCQHQTLPWTIARVRQRNRQVAPGIVQRKAIIVYRKVVSPTAKLTWNAIIETVRWIMEQKVLRNFSHLVFRNLIFRILLLSKLWDSRNPSCCIKNEQVVCLWLFKLSYPISIFSCNIYFMYQQIKFSVLFSRNWLASCDRKTYAGILTFDFSLPSLPAGKSFSLYTRRNFIVSLKCFSLWRPWLFKDHFFFTAVDVGKVFYSINLHLFIANICYPE